MTYSLGYYPLIYPNPIGVGFHTWSRCFGQRCVAEATDVLAEAGRIGVGKAKIAMCLLVVRKRSV